MGGIEASPSLEKTKEHVILEIGSGIYPMLSGEATPDSYREWVKKRPDVRHIALDRERFYTSLARAIYAEDPGVVAAGVEDRTSFVRADGTHLPFADESIEEVILRNTLGFRDIAITERMGMLHEAARVLRQGGLISIFEQYTPEVARHVGVQETVDMLLRSGFEPAAPDTLEPLQQEIDTHMLTTNSPEGKEPFVLRLRKRPTAR
jgi:ubiquinone/menaquinone biosynthesis C-methylase UbiE